MSGRDYRVFLSTHRTSFAPEHKDTARLALHADAGFKNVRYKAVDYDQLRALAQEKRLAANASLVKVKKLQKLSKDGRETGVLAQHRKVWLGDMVRLDALRARLSSASAAALDRAVLLEGGGGGSGDDDDDGVLDIVDYAARLDDEREAFKRDTIEPVQILRDDLRFWLSEIAKRNDADQKPLSGLGDPQQIESVISSVKQQQAAILNRLDAEARALITELEADPANGYIHSTYDDTSAEQMAKGIPLEAYDFPCPDDEIKTSLLEQFLLLDHKYCERLAQLQEDRAERAASAAASVAFVGRRGAPVRSGGNSPTAAAAGASQRPPETEWSPDDEFALGALLDAYSCDAVVAQHRRHLVTDRLARQWPRRTAQELADRESRLLASRSLRQQRKVVARDWTRSRAELLTKIRAACLDMCAAHELQAAQQERLQRQQEMCRLLFEKVQAWREQKIEAMTLEQEMLRERLAAEQLALKAQEEKEVAKRTADKAKVEAYRQRQEEERRLKEQLSQERLDALKDSLAQQAAYDRKRVTFRETELLRRQVEQQKAREMQAAEQEERERRLEALRETVRVNIERDPLRLMSDTESWQHKLYPNREGPVNIQQPLFDIHTFTDQQITADPRLRLEQRLREAGLHATDYARQVLSQTRGPQPPRRDAVSTFKIE